MDQNYPKEPPMTCGDCEHFRSDPFFDCRVSSKCYVCHTTARPVWCPIGTPSYGATCADRGVVATYLSVSPDATPVAPKEAVNWEQYPHPFHRCLDDWQQHHGWKRQQAADELGVSLDTYNLWCDAEAPDHQKSFRRLMTFIDLYKRGQR